MRLLRAVENNANSANIEELLQTYPNLNFNLQYHGYTCLHKTFHDNMNYDAFVLLVKRGADVNAQDKRGNTVAHYIASGQVGDEWDVMASLKLLAEYGADFNLTNTAVMTPLESIPEYYYQDREVYRFLLQHTDLPIAVKLVQAIKQEIIENVHTFLVEIASKGQATAVDVLNTEVDKYGLIGNVACGVGNRVIIDLLVENGCDLRLVAEDGTTALEKACYADNANSLNAEDRVALITWLIDEIKTDITSIAIQNSLHCSNLEILQLLLERGGNVNSVYAGITPLLLIINQTYVDDHEIEVIELLLRYGANILVLDGYVGNSLHLAAERGHIHVVEVLLNHANDTNQLDQLLQPSSCRVCYGMDAYDIAQEYGYYEIAARLYEYFDGDDSTDSSEIDASGQLMEEVE